VGTLAHVSGAAALLKGYNPSLSALQLKSIIMDSVDPVASMNGITVTGGRLNINNALMNNCLQTTEIPYRECETLVTFYNSTNGDNWTDNTGWNETNTPCSWYGVTCSGGHTSELALSSNGLTGSIPTELGNLSNLEKLSLDNNQLTSSIPTELGNLNNLQYLWLHNNGLCGEIPVELKNLSNITNLKLDNNHLTADDAELIAWLDSHNPGWDTTQTPCPPKLQFSSATYNIREDKGQATITVTRTDSSDGAISVNYATSDDTATAPDDYTQTTGTLDWTNGDDADKTFTINIIHDSEQENDETLIVSLNNASGGAELGTPNTAVLTINNSINCATVTDIPYEECEVLVTFYDSTGGDSWTDNSGWLETNTPCSWKGVTCSGGHVSEIDLYKNQLTGSIPSELGNLSHLTYLSLGSNDLTGSIPSELGNLSHLTYLSLGWNSLTGSIPSELGNLSHLTYLSLGSNDLTGSIPSELGNLSNLTTLELYGNSLTGSIPSQLYNLSNLTSFGLGWNSLTGTILSDLGNLTHLTSLNLAGNNLTGSIPSQLGNLSDLRMLWLNHNSLTGSIPSELGNLSNLKALSLHFNQLSGSIPTELGNLSNLTNWLVLKGNDLTGSIPSELGNLSNLMSLKLSFNSLTGSIPTELGNLSNLKYLFLYNNQLCGEIPVELKNLSNIPLPDDCYYDSCLDIDNNHLTATDSELIEWLDTYNPGWETTQTPCPQPQCKLQFSSATYSVAEDGGQKTITVTRTNSSDGAVSVEYATSDDTATAPDDYTETSGTLNWTDGDDADKTFPVDIIDDTQQENDETLIVSLGNPTGGAQLGTPDTATLTITDNDTSGSVVLSVEPPESNVSIGQEFEVNIIVKAGTQQINGASAYLDFDPTYLQVVSMTPADHLDQILDNVFDNGAGHIDFAAGKLTSPYPTGNFELVTIRLKAKAEISSTTLSFVFNQPRRTNATFGGESVFDHAEDGVVHISAGALVKGSVELQGRESKPKPDPSWETDVYVSFTVPSETEPRYSFETTTNQNGEFEVGPIDPADYEMRVKGTHTLQNQVTVSLAPGENNENAGELLEGDANDDNCVTILDFSILADTFSKCEGDTGFDHRADFNQDNCVTIPDFSLLATNFKQCGAPNPSMMVSPLTATEGTVVMSVEPSTTQVNVGETFEIAIKVQAGEQQIDAASAYLDFDPTYLEVVSITPADHLDLILDNDFDNGHIDFAAGKLTSPFPSGDFELVTITLRAKAETSETTLEFLFNPPRRTNATFGGASVFDHAEDGNVTITATFSCKKVTEIPKKECQALVALYDSTNGENWEDNTGWNATNSPCSWYGVTCQGRRVTGLSLGNNNLKGSISKKFFKLKKLKTLILSDNDLNGTSLKNFCKLKKLETLCLDNSRLSGNIFNCLCLMKLKKLKQLCLDNNCFPIKVPPILKKWLDGLNPGWDETQTACF
jgi:Leucine-rich repeat (LRR) protein